MTWYHNGKAIDYDHNGENGLSDIWGVLIDLHGSAGKALSALVKEGGCEFLFDHIAEIHKDPTKAIGYEIQETVDEIIWSNAILASDEYMESLDPKDRYLVVTGFKFEWRED